MFQISASACFGKSFTLRSQCLVQHDKVGILIPGGKQNQGMVILGDASGFRVYVGDSWPLYSARAYEVGNDERAAAAAGIDCRCVWLPAS